MNQYSPSCACYVATLEPIHQFTLRYGAHDTSCPVYRMSRDPVDNMKDEMARLHFTKEA